MKLTILGGKKEIGGNKILVEHKGTRIFLDFGMSFGQASKFFSEFLQPRKSVALKDFFEFDLLPDMKGLYRTDYLKHMGRKEEKKEIDAILFSHAHADHAQYLHFIRSDIPLYCTKPTKIILQALEETGSSQFSDLATICEAFAFYTNTKGSQSRVTRSTKSGYFVKEREFIIPELYQKFKIGFLDIELVPVDHSLPGACGFIIYTDEGNLVYTGDIRFHGSNKELSRKFVEKAKAAKPRWMLSEGTRMGEKRVDSEEKVQKEISKLISKAKGVVFVEHPIRDLDRVISIYRATKENKRELVVNMKLAYLIQALGDICPFSLDDVKILVPPKSWGLICKDGFDCKAIEADYMVWEREFINLKNSITFKELKKSPKKYVVSMNMFEINQLTDIQPKNAIWVKSSCEPFCEEMELDEQRKKKWLDHFKIKEYFAHASGHASGDEIKSMIKEINPKELIPIHTEHPEMF